MTSDPGQNSPEHKNCHFCAEEILLAAKKCKHCGEFISDDSVQKPKGDIDRRETLRQFGVSDSGIESLGLNSSNVDPTSGITYTPTGQTPNGSTAQPGGIAPSSNGLAGLMSFFIPGAGQLYKGKAGQGVLWFLFTLLGYSCFIVPGLFIHLFCVINAAGTK